jgi:hypothetical protein
MTDIAREENLATFVGKNEEYYLRKWELFEHSNEKISWNWAAFFFSSYWMMYRKMYIPAVAVFVGSRLVKYLIALAGGKSYRLITLIVSVALGMLGNWIYYTYANRKIDDVADAADTEDPMIIGRTLREMGGVSWLWFFGLVIVGNLVDSLLKAALAGRALMLDQFDEDTFLDII